MAANTGRKGLEQKRVYFSRAVLLFFLFFAIGLGLARNSLSYPWFWDDYHLIRVFSGAELESVLVGNWDVDHIESKGYRPGTVFFDHLRGLLFGENPLEQRVFVIALFAAGLTVWALIAVELGTSPLWAALAGVLALCARNNWYNLVWITDGVRVLTGLLLGLAVWSMLLYVRKPGLAKLVFCVVMATAAIFTREESLLVLPLIPICALSYLFDAFNPKQNPFSILAEWRTGRRALPSAIKGIVFASGLLFVISVFYFLLREIFIPWTPTLFYWRGGANNVYYTLYPMGVSIHSLLEQRVYDLWTFALGMLAMGLAFVVDSGARRQSLFWLAFIVLNAVPGMVFPYPRPNLLFFPILFFSLSLANLLRGLTQRSVWLTAGVILLTLSLLVVSADRSMIAQQSTDPHSLDYYTVLAYEPFVWSSTIATIPDQRRAQIIASLAQMGIYTQNDFEQVLPRLQQEAQEANRDQPTSDGQYFIPRIHFLEP